jgi:tripeptide aminopeptidase
MHSLPINRERLVRTFIGLASISSPSFAEDRVFDSIYENLRQLGLKLSMQDYKQGKNLVAVLPASDPSLPTIALSAHADTVGPCENICIETDGVRIQTDGTTILGGDDKAAIAEIIEALSLLIESGLPHGRIEIIITSGEEVGLVGAKNLDISLISATHCLVLDASGEVGTAVIGAPNQVSFAVDIRGKKAHAGIEPEKGINAIVVAAEIITHFPVGRLDEHSVANYGSITGGGASNIVPDHVTIHGEIRSHDLARLEAHIANLKSAANLVGKTSQAVVTVTITPEYQAFLVSEDAPIVNMVREACQTIGLPFSAIVAGGGSDANVLASRGLSCVNLACGMRMVHTNEEYVLIDDLVSTTRLLTTILCDKIKLLPKTAAN